MRITWRLCVTLVLAVACAALLFAFHQGSVERTRLEDELDRRAWLRVEELGESLVAARRTESAEALEAQLDQAQKRERVEALALYDEKGRVVAASTGLADGLAAVDALVRDAIRSGAAVDDDHWIGETRLRVHAQQLFEGREPAGALAVFQDARYVDEHIASVRSERFVRMFVQAGLISALTLLVLRWSLLAPVKKLVGWIRDLRTGQAPDPPRAPPVDLLEPLAAEIDRLAKSYFAARSAAREGARLHESGEAVWTAERLKEHCAAKLAGRTLVVVTNREPYLHHHDGKNLRCLVPASGLVTALEPILRACGGTWIAHGSGSADREVVDRKDRLRVPPEDPHYTLRRVWLSKQEEQGFYDGFSNEGLWPLCHIAHIRPLFRPDDWAMYRAVNERFCQAVLEEIEGAVDPWVLIHDYPFALLAKLVKERRPDARVAIFWHIPWPNPEAIAICPWQRELLQGLLAADLVGFHTQFHGNQFLATVDRALEARIDLERSAVVRQNHVTQVKAFPISVAFTGTSFDLLGRRPESARPVSALGFEPRFLGVGVDRLDYTKGIPERFAAIERFLEKHPQYQGQFTFVELGAPSRTSLARYQALIRQVESEAERINARFQKGSWKPIVLFVRHHSHAEIEAWYRAADVCVVSSLHDGMNLVAKEFVSARSDELGVLVLSRFAGASHEMRDALIVNPYDVEQTAEAIRYALEIDDDERRARMRRLRATLCERNVYRWAAELIGELAQIRLDRAKPKAPTSP